MNKPKLKIFKGQVATITGAASGLGVAIAAKLYAEGVRLVLMDINGNKLQQVVSEFFPRLFLIRWTSRTKVN